MVALGGLEADVGLGYLDEVHRHHVAERRFEMVVELLALHELGRVANPVAAGKIGRDDHRELWPAPCWLLLTHCPAGAPRARRTPACPKKTPPPQNGGRSRINSRVGRY